MWLECGCGLNGFCIPTLSCVCVRTFGMFLINAHCSLTLLHCCYVYVLQGHMHTDKMKEANQHAARFTLSLL